MNPDSPVERELLADKADDETEEDVDERLAVDDNEEDDDDVDDETVDDA